MVPTIDAPQSPKSSAIKKGFFRRILPGLLITNVAIGVYVLVMTSKKEQRQRNEGSTTGDSTSVPPVTGNVALPGKTSPAESSIPVRVLPPIPEPEQRELFRWMLEEKRKVKPRNPSEKKKIDEEKALLKEILRAKSIPSFNSLLDSIHFQKSIFFLPCRCGILGSAFFFLRRRISLLQFSVPSRLVATELISFMEHKAAKVDGSAKFDSGHVGICREDGAVLDFAGSNFVNVDNFEYGAVAKYLQLDRKKCCFPPTLSSPTCHQSHQHVEHGSAISWDDALDVVTKQYHHKSYNLFTCNCHCFVANCLNRLAYDGRLDWNVLNLAVLILWKGRWVDGMSVFRSFCPFAVVFCIGMLMAGWPFPIGLASFSFVLIMWFFITTYCMKSYLD
ncbi:hypothetical protein HPP92_007450 [Vanilla planifolia]|uniref:Uncharacterized protein n=1 Tax=Vanilla planifolia TaxID=51239 RepID=A0A835RR77_VANPL|nr:hypothetical protein HPP92_007450 [Vanilla planifolia]